MHSDIPFYLEQYKYIRTIYGEPKIKKEDFLCPICFKDIPIGELSREHFPPKSLGGKMIVFTCEKCNNKAGHEIEGHLKSAFEFFRNKSFPSGASINVNVDFGQNANFRGQITRKVSDQFTLYIDERKNNPKLIKDLNNKISIGDRKLTVNPTKRHKISNNRIMISLLKTAYLQVFWRFGYIPIYDSYFQPLRDQIMNPNKIIYPLELCYLTDEKMPINNGVNIFEVNRFKFLISSFKLKYEDIVRQFNIIIPLFVSKNGIGSDLAYIFYDLKKFKNGDYLTGNTISETYRPIISSECVSVSKYLINIFYN